MREVELTITEGQWLLMSACAFSAPDALGDKKPTQIEKACMTGEVIALYEALKGVSPLVGRWDRKGGKMFGPEEAWELHRNPEGTILKGSPLIDSLEKPVAVKLGRKALDGATAILVLAVTPGHPLFIGTAGIVDTVWPLAAKLKRLAAVKAGAGYDDKEQPARWADDAQ